MRMKRRNSVSFFVGITRAKEHLELSYYTSPGQYRAAPGPSRYLRMIPENLIEGRRRIGSLRQRIYEDLKRQILAERAIRAYRTAGSRQNIRGKNPSANTGTKNISAGNETVTTEKRRVRHTKYGTGSVVREDDMMLTVDFDDYGEKRTHENVQRSGRIAVILIYCQVSGGYEKKNCVLVQKRKQFLP